MNVKPKKSLGQNFLVNKDVINTIVNTIDLENKTILEVGPGTGNLTHALLKKKPKKFFVVEKDTNLSSILKAEFKEAIN